MAEENTGILEDKVVGEAIRLQDVENFFKYAINPSLIEAKIEKTTAAQMRERGGLNTTVLISIGIVAALIFVGGGLGYSFIQQSSMSQDWATCSAQLAVCHQTGIVTQTTQTTNTNTNLPPISIK